MLFIIYPVDFGCFCNLDLSKNRTKIIKIRGRKSYMNENMTETHTVSKPWPTGLKEEQLRLMISSIKDYAIFMLDPGGHIISWNPGAERIKGYKENEIVGKHFSTFYPVEDVQRGKPEWELKEAV